jgi:plastocyanin
MDQIVVQPPLPTNTNAPRPRRKWLASGLIGLVLVVVIGAVFMLVKNKDQTVDTASGPSVQVTSSAFSPSTITVKKNQSVTWTNADTASHEVASDPYPSHAILPALASSSLNQGDSYTFTFEKTGTYTYHDPLNPAAIKGTVIVE